MYASLGKRILDVVVAGAAVVVLSPVLLGIAVAIWLEDRQSVLFRQDRVGRRGESFEFLKFRSMPVGTAQVTSDQAGQLTVTRVGQLLRRTNLDELPQLLNILRGDMSVVGPRPPIPSQEELVDHRSQSGALLLRPGLTGLAQIRSYDGMPWEEKAKWDAEYAADVSLVNDLKIILATFAYLRRPPPAY